jgi:hypothetical protein
VQCLLADIKYDKSSIGQFVDRTNPCEADGIPTSVSCAQDDAARLPESSVANAQECRGAKKGSA